MSQLDCVPALIVAHWHRTTADCPFIHDIVPIICRFTQFERFNAYMSASCLQFDKDALMVTRLHDFGPGYGWQVAYGSILARPGSAYKWNLKIVENANGIMIGIIANSQCWDSQLNKFFFKSPTAIAYHGSSGYYFTGFRNGVDILDQDAEPYGQDDTIGITLNLRNYGLSFSKNGKMFGLIGGIVKKRTAYRLVVGCFNHGLTQQIEIVGFANF